MSYDLYLWKWRHSRHVSAATCFLLMADGLECEDAALIEGKGLKAKLLGSLSGMAIGEVDCEVGPRGLILEGHGVSPAALLDLVAPVARLNGLVVFDPQEDDVSEEDRRNADALARHLRSEDDQVRLEAEMPELIARADAGDAAALVELGNRYFFGEALAKDVAEAFRLYLRAAEAGSDAGMVNVASCYRKGDGIPRDLDQAMKWYERAMKTDHTFAPFELGEMYEIGEGVAQDRDRAIQLFSIALEGDHPEARKALRRLGVLPPVSTVLSDHSGRV
jgi:tetratricopeptide (TPR) repeat protein